MNTPTAFEGSIPESYDTYLGPLLFEFSAKDFAKRVKGFVGETGEILEVAAGTGISTEYLRNELPQSVKILATDLSEDMLRYARKKRGNLQNVTYAAADALALPYEDNRFDVVACQFGIMFFPDKRKGLEEMLRVTKPGGTVLFNVWDSHQENKVVKIASEVTSDFFESNPPKFLHIPFGYHNTKEIRELMESVGLKGARSEVVRATVEGNSPENIARGLVTGNPMIAELKARGTASPDKVVTEVKEAIQKEYGEKPQVELQKIVFWGTKPEESAPEVAKEAARPRESKPSRKTAFSFTAGVVIGALLSMFIF